jgi:RNA polymerase sigma-70 factor (sigma-E family)
VAGPGCRRCARPRAARPVVGAGGRVRGQSSRDAQFTAFVTESYSALLRSACLITGDWHSAEDLLQTVLTRLYVRWGRAQGWDSPRGYARRVLVNQYLNSPHLTSRRRRWNHEASHDHDHLPEEPAAGRDGGDAIVARRVLGDALRALPDEFRVVLVLRFFEDLSIEEVAALLDCPVGTVKSRTSRALAQLRAGGALADFDTNGAA